MNMMTGKNVFKVLLRAEEYERIKRDHPGKVGILDHLVGQQGDNWKIILDRKTGALIRDMFGDTLYDRLYAKAYALKGDKYYSYFLQLQEILKLPKSKVDSILEIGPGYNILNSLLGLYDYRIFTMDVQQRFSPSLVGDVLYIPVKPDAFDLVCSFEVLQHLPFRHFRQALENIVQCARHYVFISLPCPTNYIYLHFRNTIVQRIIRRLSFDLRLFKTFPSKAGNINEEALKRRDDRHNPHYWEVNRSFYPKDTILRILEEYGVKVTRHFHNPLHPYHWFILGDVA